MMAAPQIIYTVIDASGERGTTSINVPTGFQLSDYGEFAVAMGTFLDALLGGRVESADICFAVDISGLTSNTALSTSDVEEYGAFKFDTVDGFPVNVNIPCIDELVVGSGSDDLDQANADVAAFISAMENGIAVSGAATITPCDIAESDINTVVTARERFRASGKRA